MSVNATGTISISGRSGVTYSIGPLGIPKHSKRDRYGHIWRGDQLATLRSLHAIWSSPTKEALQPPRVEPDRPEQFPFPSRTP